MPEAERKLFSTGIHLGIKPFGDIMHRVSRWHFHSTNSLYIIVKIGTVCIVLLKINQRSWCIDTVSS